MEIRRFPANAPRKGMLKIARQYAAAIVRRGREATTPEFLADVWRCNGASFVRQGQNFLILHELGNSGWYVASHFAPASIRGGYELLRAVRAANLPIIFTVPDDLARDLARIGWKKIPAWARAIADARGLICGKEILIPAGMMTAAWKTARAFDWHGLYADNRPAQPVYNIRVRDRGPAYTPPKRATIGDFWPGFGKLAVN